MRTRSRGDLSWMIVSRVMIRVKTKFVELSLWVPDQLTQVVGESMAELQQSDTNIGPILRWRPRQTEQPRPEEVVIEVSSSESTVESVAQFGVEGWSSLSSN